MWNISDYPIEDKLNTYLMRIQEGTLINLPGICPVCGRNEVHIYFNRHRTSKIGGVWVWCSSCRHYTHGTYLIPQWWENNPEIIESELTHAPDVLEMVKDEIDKHFNKLYGNFVIK